MICQTLVHLEGVDPIDFISFFLFKSIKIEEEEKKNVFMACRIKYSAIVYFVDTGNVYNTEPVVDCHKLFFSHFYDVCGTD